MRPAMVAAAHGPVKEEPRRKTLARQVAERLLERIRSGELRPGQRLPTELELVRELGVGRSSVREALQALVVIGAVDVRPRRGAVVRSIGGTDFRLDRALAPLLDSDTLLELSEMRRIVEPEVAALAAQRIEASGLEAARTALEALRTATEPLAPGEFIRADLAFHQAVAQAAGNRVILGTMGELQELLRASRLLTMQAPGALARTVEGHGRIYRALAAGDPEAARAAMRMHLEDSRLDLLTARAGEAPRDELPPAESRLR
jgi:GntR family transcriptional repressor for pyruvate dehydrogenase complex